MSSTTTGWVIFLAAVGMMFSLLAVDLASLQNWHEAQTPAFVGSFIGHIAAVIAAFVGGKLIPSAKEQAAETLAATKGTGE